MSAHSVGNNQLFDERVLVGADDLTEPGRWYAQVNRLPVLLLVGDLIGAVIAVSLSTSPLPQAVAYSLFLLGALGLSGLYKSRLDLSVLDDLPRLATGWLVGSASVLALNAGADVPRGNTAALTLIGGAVLVLMRGASYALTRRLRRTGLATHQTLIIGTNPHGQRIGQILDDHPEYGLRPIGHLVDASQRQTNPSVSVIGSVRDLTSVIDERNVSVAILANDDVPDHDMVQLLRSCHRLRCELFVIPHFAELHSVNDDTELIWGVPLVRLRRAAHRTWSWQLKRCIDVVVSATAALLLLPVLASIAVAVRREGGPGIIFRQTRVGIDGQVFELLKFRSMKPVDETESATQWNIAQDNRVGSVGRFIRRTSLDELPQLWNILRGDMSLVGPRPERPHFVREFSDLYPSYQSRDRVPCGLTGWAQVHGLRGDTPVDQRADFDNFYIENWSLWLDVKIILKTVVSVVSAPGS